MSCAATLAHLRRMSVSWPGEYGRRVNVNFAPRPLSNTRTQPAQPSYLATDIAPVSVNPTLRAVYTSFLFLHTSQPGYGSYVVKFESNHPEERKAHVPPLHLPSELQPDSRRVDIAFISASKSIQLFDKWCPFRRTEVPKPNTKSVIILLGYCAGSDSSSCRG